MEHHSKPEANRFVEDLLEHVWKGTNSEAAKIEERYQLVITALMIQLGSFPDRQRARRILGQLMIMLDSMDKNWDVAMDMFDNVNKGQ